MTVLEDEDRPDKIIYMNVWETIRVDLEMHRRGAKQVREKKVNLPFIFRLNSNISTMRSQLTFETMSTTSTEISTKMPTLGFISLERSRGK